MSWDAGAGLKGKRVVVTGAAGTIGGAVVRAFAGAEAHVCLVDMALGPIEDLRGTLADPGAHIAVACDLCAVAEMESMFDEVRSFFGGLDVLVHVAGVLARTQVEDVTEEIWDWHLDNNLKATFFVDRAAARLMREGGKGGRIINFASDAWWTGGLHAATAYAASKGGVVSVSRGLAKAFARDGITVNCVAPGTVDSRMLRSGLSEEQIAHLTDVIPLGRLAQPEDVAAATVFLASDHAGFITATTLNVSGGELIY